MSAELTAALGRLLSDGALREMLRRDLEAASRVLGVGPDLLRGLDPVGLEQQARSLIDKRFFEVSKRLPRTLAGLEDDPTVMFRRYATGYWPDGYDRHLKDAAAFGASLERRGLPVCRAELNRVRFASGRWPVSIRFAPDVWAAGRSRRALQILVRWGTDVRSWAIYFGR